MRTSLRTAVHATLFAAVAAELVMGEQSITTFQRSPDRAN
jgi:ABC-type nitrate/sulfonate/bicarbonate transport system permease component